MSVKCTKCGVEKDPTAFKKDPRKRNGLSSHCRECTNAARLAWHHKNAESQKIKMKEYRSENKEYFKRKGRERGVKNKLIAMTYYCNGKPYCVGCGVENMEVLTLDHINEDGAEHRRVESMGSTSDWVVQNGLPSGFQVLCWNCNNAKHRHQSVPVYTYKEGFMPSIQYPKE